MVALEGWPCDAHFGHIHSNVHQPLLTVGFDLLHGISFVVLARRLSILRFFLRGTENVASTETPTRCFDMFEEQSL